MTDLLPFLRSLLPPSLGGEDAFFSLPLDVGVFDGVGGWSLVVREGGREGRKEGGGGNLGIETSVLCIALQLFMR